jgi:hypothetical protein
MIHSTFSLKQYKSVSITEGDVPLLPVGGDGRPHHVCADDLLKNSVKVSSPAEQMLEMLDGIIRGEQVSPLNYTLAVLRPEAFMYCLLCLLMWLLCHLWV